MTATPLRDGGVPTRSGVSWSSNPSSRLSAHVHEELEGIARGQADHEPHRTRLPRGQHRIVADIRCQRGTDTGRGVVRIVEDVVTGQCHHVEERHADRAGARVRKRGANRELRVRAAGCCVDHE